MKCLALTLAMNKVLGGFHTHTHPARKERVLKGFKSFNYKIC